MTKKPGPKKGTMPDMSGVPGELVSDSTLPEDIHWGAKRRMSPYDGPLKALADAGPGKVLRFGELKARLSVPARAKKLGLRIECGEKDGVLYVRYLGHVEDDVKASRRSEILGALKFGPATAMKLANLLRMKGDSVVDAQLVEAILVQLARTGEVVTREGGEYGLNPRHGKAA